MSTKRGWQAHEQEVAKILGLEKTLASGSQFFDPGDATTRNCNARFPIWADAKYTEAASFPLKLRELTTLSQTAAEVGKRFVLPVRFWPKHGTWLARAEGGPHDYAVLSLHDLAELLALAEG
jgi:hypothetical protein